MILVDTHVAVWITTENPTLGNQSRAVLAQALMMIVSR